MDVHQYLCGCLSAFTWKSISTFVEFHQRSYRCPSVSLRTFIRFLHTDGYQVLCGQPSVLYVIHQSIFGRLSMLYLTCVRPSVYYGRLFEYSLMEINFQKMYIRTVLDVHQFLAQLSPQGELKVYQSNQRPSIHPWVQSQQNFI